MPAGSNTTSKPCQMGLWPNNSNFHRMPSHQFFLAIKNTFRRTASSALTLDVYRKNSSGIKAPSERAKAPKWRTEWSTSTLSFTRKPGRIPIILELESDEAIQRQNRLSPSRSVCIYETGTLSLQRALFRSVSYIQNQYDLQKSIFNRQIQT